MSGQEFIPRKTVMQIGLISEAVIALAGLSWIWFFDTPLSLSPSARGLIIGILASAPMLAFNIFVFARLSSASSPWPVYHRFKRDVVIPLCGDLTVIDGLLLSVIAGFSEELLFRGAMQLQFTLWSTPLISIICVNLIFSYVHFIGMARQYWQLILVYFLFGLYFSAIAQGSGNLFAAMIMHAFYDFAVIFYLLKFEIRRGAKEMGVKKSG